MAKNGFTKVTLLLLLSGLLLVFAGGAAVVFRQGEQQQSQATILDGAVTVSKLSKDLQDKINAAELVDDKETDAAQTAANEAKVLAQQALDLTKEPIFTTGATGTTGARGETGPSGANGVAGAAGADGTPGQRGEQGATGVQGEQGEQGPQGTQGAQGAQGPQGVQGPQGPQGEQGPAGSVTLDGTSLQQSVSGLSINFSRDNTWSGAQSYSSAITAPTSTNTINGVVINSGALSSVASLTGSGALSVVSGGTNTALSLDSNGEGAINIGTGSAAKVISIGNSSGTTGLVFSSGSGNISFDSGTTYIDTTSNRLGVNTSSPDEAIQVVGSAMMGEDTLNYVKFESDGTLQFNGTATVWEDLRFPATAINPTGAPSPMTFDTTNIGFSAAASGTQVIAVVGQMPHAWKQGSSIVPHIHWSPTSTDTGSVLWRLEYKWTNINDTESGSFTTVDVLDPGDGTTLKHQLASFGSISGTGKTLSSALVMKISRIGGDASDTYADAALMREFDIHYEIDTIGSRSEYVK